MKIANLFPTPVGTFKLQDCSALNKGLTDFIYSIRDEDSPQRSMVGGYHTNEDLFNRKNTFANSFSNVIANQVKEYYLNLTGKQPGPNTRMGCWGMIYGKGHYSKPHTHPLADISTAYYIKVPKLKKGEGSFVITDPRPAANWDRNFQESTTWEYTVEEGMGIIFPGWLEHYVTPHNSDDDRICITTNIFIDHGTFFK